MCNIILVKFALWYSLKHRHVNCWKYQIYLKCISTICWQIPQISKVSAFHQDQLEVDKGGHKNQHFTHTYILPIISRRSCCDRKLLLIFFRRSFALQIYICSSLIMQINSNFEGDLPLLGKRNHKEGAFRKSLTFEKLSKMHFPFFRLNEIQAEFMSQFQLWRFPHFEVILFKAWWH